MANTTYYKRKEQGLCVACGKKLDRVGMKCTECLEKSNKVDRDTYHWLQQNGICPVCRKERLMKNEKSCLECKARKTNNSSIRLSKNKNEIRKIISKRDADRYTRRKELGLCVSCGKENESQYALCDACRIKRKHTRKYIVKHERQSWIGRGLCYWCGKPALKPYKVCETHLETIRHIAHLPQTQKAREMNIKQGALY